MAAINPTGAEHRQDMERGLHIVEGTPPIENESHFTWHDFHLQL